MKRIASLLICMLLLIPTIPVQADTFSPPVLSANDFSLSQWYSSQSNRELFVACAAIDATTDNEAYANLISESLLRDYAYIGKADSNNLAAFFFTDSRVLLLLYDPIYNLASTDIIDFGYSIYPNLILLTMQSNNTILSYSPVDGTNVMNILTAAYSAL